MKKAFFLLSCLFFITATFAQEKLLTIEDAVMKGRTTLAPERLSQLYWIPGSQNFAYVGKKENKEVLIKGQVGITKRDTVLQIEKVSQSLLALDPSQKAMGRFPFFTWVNESLFRYFYSNNYYLFNLKTGMTIRMHDLGREAENADFHEKSRNIAYTVKNNLYVSVNGLSRQITKDTDKGIVNGQTVHRSEFGIHNGTFWSPEGNNLAFYRMDESMVTEYPVFDIENRPATSDMIRYPMAGMKSHHVTVGVYNIKSDKTVFLKTGEPLEQYLTNITWSPDEKHIYIAVVNRKQDHMWLKKFDAVSGDFVATLFEETHPKYVEPEHGPIFIKNNPGQFLWYSERDGYNHLYLYNTSGKMLKQITKGNWLVTDFHGFDQSGKRIYFTATKESAIERHLYTVDLGSAKIERLTKGEGTHSITLNENATHFIDNYSSTKIPREIKIYDSRGKETNELLVAANPLKDYKLGDMSIFTIPTENNIPLYCRMIKPINFDVNKKYPVIVYLYGGPHLQLINNTWLGQADLWMNYMAQQGYVVFSLDNRGSLNRGLEFENATHRKLGTVEMTDQLKGVEYLKKQSFVDTTRMGVHGWSFGGFMTTTLMTRAPGTFKVGVAGGPVIDWSYYEIMYTERYMDSPEENPEGFETSNLLNHVKNLQGRLLMIHGASDDVVVWQHSLMYSKKAVDEGKLIDYFVYPGHKHNVMGPDRVHLMKKITQYFVDFL